MKRPVCCLTEGEVNLGIAERYGAIEDPPPPAVRCLNVRGAIPEELSAAIVVSIWRLIVGLSVVDKVSLSSESCVKRHVEKHQHRPYLQWKLV